MLYVIWLYKCSSILGTEYLYIYKLYIYISYIYIYISYIYIDIYIYIYIYIYCQGPQTRSRTAALNKVPFLIPTTGVRWSAVRHPQPQITWSMDQSCTYSNSSRCQSHWMHQVNDCSTFYRFKSPITGSPALHFSSDLSSTDSKTSY